MTEKDSRLNLGIGLLIAAFLTWKLAALGWDFVNQEESILYALDTQEGSIQWSAKLGDGLPSQPEYNAGRLFVNFVSGNEETGFSRELLAFDGSTGQRLWATSLNSEKYQIGTYFARRAFHPLARAGFVVTGLTESSLGIFDAGSGDPRYIIEGVHPRHLQTDNLDAAIDDQRLIVFNKEFEAKGTKEIRVEVFDLHSGASIWSGDGIPSYRGYMVDPIVLHEQMIYITGNNRSTAGYDLHSGVIQFRLDPECQQLVAASTANYCINESTLRAHNAVTGAALWAFDSSLSYPNYLQNIHANDQSVYVTIRDVNPESLERKFRLLALNAADGQVRWEKMVWDDESAGTLPPNDPLDYEYPFFYRPTTSPGKVFTVMIYAGQASLVALSEEDGTVLWHFPIRSYPRPAVVGEDLIYAVDRAPRWRSWLAYLNSDWR